MKVWVIAINTCGEAGGMKVWVIAKTVVVNEKWVLAKNVW